MRRLALGAIAIIALVAVPIAGRSTFAATSPEAVDALAVDEYSSYLGVDKATAAQYVSWTASASKLQDLLAAAYPKTFGGLWVAYKAGFEATVAFSGGKPLYLEGSPDLLARVHQVAVGRSLEDLTSLVSSIEFGDTPGDAFVDVKTNQVVIDVLESDRSWADATAASLRSDKTIRVDVVSALPSPVGNIYGGLNLDAWCGGVQGTSGFSVVKNSNEVTGVLTAGHLSNCLRYGTTNLVFQAESLTGNADAQWHSSPVLTEQPWVWVGDNLLTITGQRTYASIVVGEMFCKYGRATGFGCGTVETKVIDPDGGGPLNPVFVRVAHCGVEDLAEPGDSGGPVFVGHAAVGISTHQDGDIFCGGKMVFNSVTHSQAKLGVSILFGS